MDENERDRVFEEGREVGFGEGREVGRREGLPFTPIEPLPYYPQGARFVFDTSWVESFVDYERELTECLRAVQSRRWIRGDLATATEAERLAEEQRAIEGELRRARRAVDAEIAKGEGRPRIIEALRGPPRRSERVREYPSIEAFLAEDRRRALLYWPGRRDASGSDWGYRWRLERPVRRWETTRWRVSWLGHDDPTNELYAVEFAPRHDPEPGTRRVWLLGTLANWREVEAVIAPLEAVAEERNSLVAVANAVIAAARQPDPEREL